MFKVYLKFVDIWPKTPSLAGALSHNFSFQHNKNGRNERLLDAMLFKLIKKMRKDCFL